MAKAIETVLCLNSFNRDIAVYPQPNDFILDLKGRYEVQYASLGTLEMPLSQYTVEEEWDTFGFDVGSSLPDLACRSLRVITEGSSTLSVVLPPPAQAVICVAPGVWRTAQPHGLFQVTDAEVVPNGALAVGGSPVIAILDATTVTTASICTIGDIGLLTVMGAGVRSFATPLHLADALNAAFRDLDIRLQVTWCPQTARATLHATAPGICVDVGPESLLLHALGFVCRGGLVCNFPLVSENFPLGARVRCTLEAGHYDPSQFRTALEGCINPLAVSGAVPPSMIAVAVSGSPTVLVTVTGTKAFHPRKIALSVTNDLVAAGAPDVSLVFEDDRFCFVSATMAPFVVTWGGTSSDQEFASRLGFDGALPTPLGTRVCGRARNFSETPTSVDLSLSYKGQSINLKRKFAFWPRPRLQEQATGLELTSDGLAVLCAPIGCIPLEYVVELDGVNSFARATSSEGDKTLFDFLGPGPFPPAGVYTVQALLVRSSSFSLYFQPSASSGPSKRKCPPGASGLACHSRLAEIAGFPAGASSIHSVDSEAVLLAPNAWNFEQPAYVLLELGLQHMSALLSHRCKEDIKTQLFAKIPLYPPFKIERGNPMQKTGTGVSYATQLHITIWNPWHTLYKFHGREWSMTLVLGAGQKHAHTECP
jgi:hypothetical protein